MNILKLVAPVLSLTMVLAGCGDDARPMIDSNAVNTSDVHANIQMTADNTGQVFIDVELLSSDDALVVLTNKDQLWASNKQAYDRSLPGDNSFDSLRELANTTTRLEQSGNYYFSFLGLRFNGDVFYSGRLKENLNNHYYVSFLRDDFSDAIYNEVEIPDTFGIDRPLFNENSVSRSNDIEITWGDSGSNDEVSLNIYTGCLHEVSQQISITGLEDVGSFMLPASKFTEASLPLSGSCTTSIEVVKSRLGTLDQLGFQRGSFYGNRVARVIIETID